MNGRDERLRDTVARAWEQARPLALRQLATLTAAAHSLRAGRLSDSQRRDAESVAHQLSGSLGTYGFRPASAHARLIEQLLSDAQLDPQRGDELLRLVQEATRMIERDAG